jgi:hypothetical protein
MRTYSAAFKNVDIEATRLVEETRIASVGLGERERTIRRRRYKSRNIPLELVVSADRDMEVGFPATWQVF